MSTEGKAFASIKLYLSQVARDNETISGGEIEMKFHRSGESKIK